MGTYYSWRQVVDNDGMTCYVLPTYTSYFIEADDVFESPEEARTWLNVVLNRGDLTQTLADSWVLVRTTEEIVKV